jgi:hypothetical protein
MDADVLGCLNIQRQTTFNALHPALEASCQSWDSRVHVNGILVLNDPGLNRSLGLVGLGGLLQPNARNCHVSYLIRKNADIKHDSFSGWAGTNLSKPPNLKTGVLISRE